MEFLLDACEFLIMNGHNTEFTNPYKYSIRKLLKKTEILGKIKDRSKFVDANIILSANIATSVGGKDGMKPFEEITKKLNRD